MKISNSNENISVSERNGYSIEKVRFAKQALLEIGKNRRNFPAEKLVEYYNYLRNTTDVVISCKPCMMAKYINSIENYAKYGELTLINTGVCSKEDLDITKKEVKVEEVKEEAKEETPKKGKKKVVKDEEV